MSYFTQFHFMLKLKEDIRGGEKCRQKKEKKKKQIKEKMKKKKEKGSL